MLQRENQAAQKNAHDHGEKASTESGSKELTKHGGSDNSSHAPPLGTIKARCPNPLIAQQPHPFEKNTPIFTPINEEHKPPYLEAPAESKIIFDPANSGLSVPPPPLKKEAGNVICGQKQGEFNTFCIFSSKKCHKILTFYHAIITVAASNTQQSTENEGEIKEIV